MARVLATTSVAQLRLTGVFFALLTLMPVGVSAQTPSSIKEDDIQKAIFISRFTDFVKWPDVTFDVPKSPFNFCVYGGERAFAEALTLETLNKKVDFKRQDGKVDHHPIHVRWLKEPPDTHDCQVLFIAGSQANAYKTILGTVHGKPCLTVGETDEFVMQGGIVSVYFQNQGNGSAKVTTGLNPSVAKEAKLQLNSRVLDIARLLVVP